MSTPSRRPGPDSTLGETRERLVAAGTAALLETGVGLGLSHVTLSDAIRATGISRTTAYRSLGHDDLDPQQLLRQEVLARVLSRDNRGAARQAIEIAVRVEFERSRQLLESDDIADRTQALRAIIRVGCAASYHAVAATRERAILIAAYGAVGSQVDRAPEWQREALRSGEHEIARLFAELYTGLSAIFGFQLRPSFSMEQFATAAAALVEGIAMRSSFSDVLDGIGRPTGPDGAEEIWTLFGIGFEGMYRTFFEPVSETEPFADLDRY